ncbi:MAG: glycosyltransferase, partial [Phycisphaerales bacterium]
FHLLARAAMLLFTVDAVVMPWLLWDKFANGVDMGTRPPFLVAIMFFLAGLFVLAAGFILENLAGFSESIRGTQGWQVREIVSGEPRDRPHA